METRCGIAIAIFLKGYDCTQSVFYAYCDDLGFDKNDALKMASWFGGGIACKGEVCVPCVGATVDILDKIL